MDRRQLAHFREELEDSKERLLQTFAGLKPGTGEAIADSAGGLAAYVSQPAGLVDRKHDRGRDAVRRINAHILLEEVEAALAKIDGGTYGVCEKCGRPIDEERLEVLPWTTRCFDCQRLDEAGDSAPH